MLSLHKGSTAVVNLYSLVLQRSCVMGFLLLDKMRVAFFSFWELHSPSAETQRAPNPLQYTMNCVEYKCGIFTLNKLFFGSISGHKSYAISATGVFKRSLKNAERTIFDMLHEDIARSTRRCNIYFLQRNWTAIPYRQSLQVLHSPTTMFCPQCNAIWMTDISKPQQHRRRTSSVLRSPDLHVLRPDSQSQDNGLMVMDMFINRG